MKKIFIALALLLAGSAAEAQTDFKASYDRQVRIVGYSGVGVETILDRWEEAEPDNIYMIEGRINYYYSKNQQSNVITSDKPKYLGNKPLISAKDSLGRPVNYFEDTVFDPDQFALCQKRIDKAIAEHPLELLYRENKITTLMAYEKESPELSYSCLVDLINYNKTNKPAWLFVDKPSQAGDFEALVQDFCFRFYTIGSYEYFREISLMMNKLYPSNPVFLSNLGSYYLVVKQDNKQALKYYNKVLKADPSNEIALTNKAIVEKRIAASKKK